MNAFVFKPTNEFIGKFDFANFEVIHAEVQRFLAKHKTLPLCSYIEASGRAWTIVSLAPLRLVDGIVSQEKVDREWPREAEPERREQIPLALFPCFQCGSSLRIRLPQNDGGFRCPKCRTEFRATKAGDSPLVFVVIPDMSQFTARASDTSTRQKRDIPSAVLTALSAFGLDEGATYEQVRSAYRELVKGYHPDRVAHLGPDLQRLAEAKTKEINSAYRVLETFYVA